jgi:hypothetical protein
MNLLDSRSTQECGGFQADHAQSCAYGYDPIEIIILDDGVVRGDDPADIDPAVASLYDQLT